MYGGSLPLLAATQTPSELAGASRRYRCQQIPLCPVFDDLLEAPGSSRLPTETQQSLIIAPWCRTSRELEQQRLAGRGHRWLPALLPARLEEKRFLGTSILRSPAPPAAPTAADSDSHATRIPGQKHCGSHRSPKPSPRKIRRHCPCARIQQRSRRGHWVGSTHPTVLPAWCWCEHPWGTVACPPPTLIPLTHFSFL